MIINIFKRTNKLFFALLFFCLFSACSQNRQKVDVTKIPLQIHINRFEESLFAERNTPLTHTDIKELRKKFPTFFNLFTNQIISIPSPDDTLLAGNLQKFIADKDIDSLYHLVKNTFRHVEDIESGLQEGFKYYAYYFPSKPIPKVVTYISGFNYAIINADSTLGIGLDMYLGKSCRFYGGLDFPRYKINRMRREYIPSDGLKSWAMSEYEQSQEEQQNLLSEMVYHGKILYFTDAMLPETADTLKIGYTGAQLDFCKKNESKIWAMFLEKKLLFSSSPKQYLKFVSDGPTTNGLPKEAPAMLGAWIGWRIVNAYMKNNPEVSLDQLMKIKDGNQILTQSNYKPEK